MARIIYGASGEGLGHATRAHSVGAGLLARGHDVRFIASLKSAAYLREIYPDRLTDIFGFALHFVNGKIHMGRTAIDILAKSLPSLRPTYRTISQLFRDFEPDLVVSDAEWFSSTLAWAERRPFISLDNQHLLTHCDADLPPGHRVHYWAARAFIRMGFSPGARRNLVTTFIRAPIRYQPTVLLPPIIRQRVREVSGKRGNYLVAYLGAQGGGQHLQNVLESFKDMPIRAYGFGLSEQRGTVMYKPTSPEGFLLDLAGSNGVIATAGHSLISECLFLEKPMLLVPIQGQYEQELNGFHVERMGVGMNQKELSQNAMGRFVRDLDRFGSALKSEPKARLEPVLDAIENELPSGL